MPNKKTSGKDWYWEAEQDRIAADEDLRLLPSPEGWPSEGLDAVGLWLLLLNQMARSRRKGFLCDPVDENKPMSDGDMAKITGRSVATVLLVLNVLLSRRLFSKNEQEIIYSRGMVRKEELRKIRSKAGKKGGLRSQSLLKQNDKQTTEQKSEQTLRIGIGIGSPDCIETINGSDGDLSPEWLAQKWVFDCRSMKNRVRRDKPEDVAAEFAEWIESGVPALEIKNEMEKKRDRTEHLWQFKQRLKDRLGIEKNGVKTKAERDDDWSKKLAEEIERQNSQ